MFACPLKSIFMMILVVLILIWCAVFVLWTYVKPHCRSPPLYPRALPGIGHAHLLFGDLWQMERLVYDYCSENGGVVEFRFGLLPATVITDLEDSLTIVNRCMDKPYLYKFGKELYGIGLVTANASIWKPHRKLLNPVFNQRILNTFMQSHSTQAKSLVSELASEVGKDPFDVTQYLLKYSLKAVFKNMIGVKPYDDHEVTITNYTNATEKYFDSMKHRLQKIWLHLPFIFNMSPLKKEQDIYVKTLKEITNAIVTKRTSALKQNLYSDSVKDATSGYKSLLDYIIHLAVEQDAFTNDEIREHLDTFMGAAYESSASAITFSLIVIGSYPDVQARIFKELQEVLDDQNRDLTKDDLPKLVYLGAVLKETLRLYPTVPRIGRCCQSAVKLKNYTIPAGRICIISLYGISRHPMWGADADQFKPERWLDPNTLPDNPNAFSIFSLGKRNCIGKQYALMFITTTLAHILRRYRVTADISKVQCECDLILKPVSGHHISLEIRA